MQLTYHFTEDELGVNFYTNQSDVNAVNNDRIRNNALIICRDLLEPIRLKVGPLIINDGYRPPDHNKAVGGVQDSYHLYNGDEAAADFVPEAYNLRAAFDYIRNGSKLNFDKVILECDKTTSLPRVIHIQYHCIFVASNKREAFEGFTFGQGDYMRVGVI